MVILLILVMIINGRNCIQEWEASFNPSFVSDWHPIEAQTASSFVTIHHYLNDTPIKVIADVKVKDGDREYIFRGMGGAERDDDQSHPYGGVLVLYDEHKVILIAPKKNNHHNCGEVIYAGSAEGWKGPNIKRNYTKADVRIRVWKSADFPEPSFLSNWTYVKGKKGQQQSIYNDIEHPMKCYPDFVNVQVKVKLKVGVFVYEGQDLHCVDQIFYSTLGSASALNKYDDSAGGAVFGYSDTSIRIWFRNTTTENKGFVFAAVDGWGGINYRAEEGYFRVITWKFAEEHVNIKELSSYKTELFQQHEIDATLVNAQFQVLEGKHAGYRFYGVGSTMDDGRKYGYGGMVYAINTSSVLMWTPNLSNGYIFNFGGMWGKSTFHQKTNNVLFRIEVINWNNNGVRCPVTNLTAVVGASMFITGNRLNDTVQYKCEEQYWYVTGNLTRTCQGDNTWSGKPPLCTIYKCPVNNLDVNNANHDVTRDSSEISVKYQCKFGYRHSDGNLQRTCQLNNSWSGKSPVCTYVKCPTENLNTSVSTMLLNITGDSYMDKASYKCSPNHRFISGENYRYCQINSTWSDLPMYCYRCRCRCRYINESEGRIAELMAKTKEQLTIEKETLSKFIRKRTSAEDNRPTAKGLGILGGVVLIVTLICIVVPDLPILRRHCVDGCENVRSRFSKRNTARKNC